MQKLKDTGEWDNTAPHSANIVGNHKLFRFYERPESLYLYDHEEDIGETTNISQQMPDLAARLAGQLDGYQAEIDAALPTPNPEAPTTTNPTISTTPFAPPTDQTTSWCDFFLCSIGSLDLSV